MITNAELALQEAALLADFKASTITEAELATGLQDLYDNWNQQLSTGGLAKQVSEQISRYDDKWSSYVALTVKGIKTLVSALPTSGNTHGDLWWVSEATVGYPYGQAYVYITSIWVAQGSLLTKGQTGAGVISGGNTGQILAKNSATNYDTLWVNPSVVNEAAVVGKFGAQSMEGPLTITAGGVTLPAASGVVLGNAGYIYGGITGTDMYIGTSANVPIRLFSNSAEVARFGAATPLTLFASHIPATGKVSYFASGTTISLADSTSYGRGLWNLADSTALRSAASVGNTDNTSDANKPVSTAQQTALDLKANIASPTLVTPILGVAAATSIATGLGLVGTPAYTFTGDLNTGLWSPAADTLAWSTGGSERMRIDATGNVGIGTTAPLATLSIGGGSIVDANVPVQISAGGSRKYFGINRTDGVHGLLVGWDTSYGGSVIRSVSASDPLSLMVNSTTRALVIDTSGNVGIGTTNPGVPLQIRSNSAQLSLETSSDPSNYHALMGAQYNYGESFFIKVCGGNGVKTLMSYGDGVGLFLASGSASPIAFSTNAAEKMRITSDGNVGIGTTAPVGKLHVSGTSTYNSDTVKALRVSDSTTITKAVDIGYDASLDKGFIQAGNFGTAYKDLLLNPNTGNVGIGTTSPAGLLHIRGDAATSKVNNLVLANNGSGSGAATAIYMGYQEAGLGLYGARILQTGYPGGTRSSDLAFQIHNGTASNDDAAWDTPLFIQRTSGNVGIGTTSPGGKLDVLSSGNELSRINGGAFYPNINGSTSYYYSGSTVSIGYGGSALITTVDGKLTLDPAGTADVIINPTSGNVGIGTTGPGAKLQITDITTADSANQEMLSIQTGYNLNGAKKSVTWRDGANITAQIAARYNGTTIDMVFGSLYNSGYNSTDRVIMQGDGHVTPGTDNTQNFGSGSLRWANGHFGTLYTTSGGVSTSDERYKVLREGGELTDAEYRAWSSVRAIVYQDKDSFEEWGANTARLHVGYSWQKIKVAFEAEGLQASRYALWCEDPEIVTVTKTRIGSRQVTDEAGQPLFEQVQKVDDAGNLVFESVQETEAGEEQVERIEIIDGVPFSVIETRVTQVPLFDSKEILNKITGEVIYETLSAEQVEAGVKPKARTTSVPRITSRPVMENKPVLEEYEEEYTVQEPTGETRGALRYQECSVFETAWLRKELNILKTRLEALETA